jgi:phosphatidylglycerophosphate synthase
MQKEIKLGNGSFLVGMERRLTTFLCRFVPASIGTKHLTMLSLFCALLIPLGYYLSAKKPAFLFLASFFILMQWIFDCLDGAIGRLRKEGFVRWGFYMDHLFDYFFMSAIVMGFWCLFPELKFQIFVMFFLFSSFMVNFFLLYASIKDREPNLTVSFWHFSPIEFRLLVIILNAMLYFFEGTTRHLIYKYLASFNICLLVILVMVIFLCQKKLNDYDVDEKK